MKGKSILTYLILSFIILGLTFSMTVNAEEEKTVEVALEGGITSLDPINTNSGTDRHVFFAIYDNLVRSNLEGEIIPGLAKDWEIKDNNRRYILHLRENVKFHDGTDFDADAVKFNLERAMGDDSLRKGELSPIKEVEIIDEYTVELNLEKAAPILTVLADWCGAIVSPAAVEKYGEDFGRNPVGSGPFKLDEWVKDDKLTLEKNENYWQEGYPKLDKAILRPIPDENTRVTEIETGNVDICALVPPKDVEKLDNKEDINVQIRNGLGYQFIFMNHNDDLFENKAIRQAVAYGINREQLAKVAFQGTATPAKGPLVPDTWAYDPDFEGIQYNSDKVEKLLAEGGKPDGFSFDMVIPNWPTEVKAAQLMQAQLSQFGIKVNLKKMELGALLDRMQQMDYQSLYINNRGRLDPGYTILNLCTTEGPYNYAGYSNPTVDKYVEAARVSTTTEESKEFYQAAQPLVVEDVPMVFLVYDSFIWASTDNVKDFDLYPDGRLRLLKVDVSE